MTAAVSGDTATTAADTATAPPATPGKALVAVPVQRASITEKLQYAQHLAQSGLLPKAYQGKPANVLYAVEYGDMLGLAPMAAITGVHVIDGKPTASSALMSALVRRAGHRLRISGNDQKATVQIIRSDDPDFTFESVWTLDRAKQAGLVGKQVWKNYPAAMLKARAISECARDACEEALLGMHYTPEELGAEVDEDGNPLRVQATAERVNNVTPINTMDWPAEIAAAEQAGDKDKLLELWRLAKVVEPLNESLIASIVEAGNRVRAAAEAAAEPAAGNADGVVDAEIVDEPAKPSKADLAQEAARIFDDLMGCDLSEQVARIHAQQIDGKPVASVDVSGLLTRDDGEALGIESGRWTLAELAGRLHGYTERHRQSPRGFEDDGEPS